ncbi:hypothetical protein [Saccharopolyspora hattusasensis]|uniref:hypothetical protein n=1 Tax=Saccharopolyspora hattusasensis TaxID=1128679 RepID=UPI003D9921A9
MDSFGSVVRNRWLFIVLGKQVDGTLHVGMGLLGGVTVPGEHGHQCRIDRLPYLAGDGIMRGVRHDVPR